MLYIGNLMEFIHLMVENEGQGTFWLQNAEYSNTTQLVWKISETHGKKIRTVRGFIWALKLLGSCSSLSGHGICSLGLPIGNVVEPMAVANSEAVVEMGGLLCAGCVVNHNAHSIARLLY